MSRDSDNPDPEETNPPEEPKRRSPINPFEAARMRPISPDIRVGWSVHDLQLLRPDWTVEQCEAFMLRHAAKFAAGMIRLGLTVLASMAADPRFSDGNGPSSSNGNGKTSPPES